MSDQCCSVTTVQQSNHTLKRVLWAVFTINAIMFVIEIVAGYYYQSTALKADSLDMLGDAIIYGASILVVAKSLRAKAQVSLVKGVIMTALALYVVVELVLRVLAPAQPDGFAISIVGTLALLANGAAFWLLWRYRSGDINMRSAWVCSRNDLVANTGVILAGLLVAFSGANWPDLLIAALIAALVLSSSVRVVVDSIRELRRTSAAGSDRPPHEPTV